MRFALMVTGPAYGTQQASSALQFAHALIEAGHELASVFFYREGVYNANRFTSPANDEFDLVRAWQALNETQGVELHICVAAALRRPLSHWLRAHLPDAIVMGINELPETRRIEVVATVGGQQGAAG